MFSFKFFVKKWQIFNLKKNIARWMACYFATTFSHNQSNKNLYLIFNVIGGYDIENVFPPLFGGSFENQNIHPFFPFIFFPCHLVGIRRWWPTI